MIKKPVFQITIDTEGDNLWAAPRNITTNNARYLSRFQSLCERHGFKPTYVVNWEMVNCSTFQDFGRAIILRSAGEIGMHLHAWNSLPIVALTVDDMKYHPYLIEFPLDVMREKIHVLTARLEDVFATKMVSHRAGRWAFNEAYARELAELGYESDCSVTPHISWKSCLGSPTGIGGTDYSEFPEKPFVIDLDNGKNLIEVPMTVSRKPISTLERLTRSILGKPMPTCWLSPNGRNLREMLQLLHAAVDSGSDYVQFMLHSSEFMPGGSPTFDTAEKIEVLYSHLEELFSAAARRFTGATMSEYVATRRANPVDALPIRQWNMLGVAN
jgi:hypothetical protein